MVTYSAHEHAITPGGTSPVGLFKREAIKESSREQFVRIASARISSKYTFEPQRRAIAARMFIEWLRRKG